MTKFSNLFGKLLNALAVAAALTLLAMVVMVTADILLRNLTRTGFAWSNEVSEYALYVITLLTAPWLLRRGQHVRVDLVLTLVPVRVAWLMEAASDVLGFAVCIIMFGGLVALMSLGLSVAFGFLAVNIVAALLFLGGEQGLSQLTRNAVQS